MEIILNYQKKSKLNDQKLTKIVNSEAKVREESRIENNRRKYLIYNSNSKKAQETEERIKLVRPM